MGTVCIELTRLGRKGTMLVSVASAGVFAFVSIAFEHSHLTATMVLLSFSDAWYQTMCECHLQSRSYRLIRTVL